MPKVLDLQRALFTDKDGIKHRIPLIIVADWFFDELYRSTSTVDRWCSPVLGEQGVENLAFFCVPERQMDEVTKLMLGVIPTPDTAGTKEKDHE